ncbi:hypothetical protein [Alcaligenes faecalis]|uniref:hypothetical protein n=1 Tax=Alcaligenes faecalis TaxID=511 RepID=UPI0034D6FB49
MSVVSCGKGLFFEYPTNILVIFFFASSRENRGEEMWQGGDLRGEAAVALGGAVFQARLRTGCAVLLASLELLFFAVRRGGRRQDGTHWTKAGAGDEGTGKGKNKEKGRDTGKGIGAGQINPAQPL